MVLMGIVAVGGIVQRIASKKGIGGRFIQFMCIGLGVPALLILAADDKIGKQVLASLIGAVIGSGVAKIAELTEQRDDEPSVAPDPARVQAAGAS